MKQKLVDIYNYLNAFRRIIRYGFIANRSVKSIGMQQPYGKPATVVFHTARFFQTHSIELFIAYILAKKGIHVKIIWDDGVLKHWDAQQIHDEPPFTPFKGGFFSRMQFHFEKKINEHLYGHKNIEYVNYSEILSSIPPKVDLSEFDRQQAISSVKRYFEEGVYDDQNSEQVAYFEDSVFNCKISKGVGQYIAEQIHPDLFLTSHGIYSLWGPCFRHVKDQGITSLIYEFHLYRNTDRKMFLLDDIYQLMFKDSDWQKHRNKSLIEWDSKTLDELFEKRLNHQSFDTGIYFNQLETNGWGLENRIQKNEGLVFGMFPNVVWDGDISERNSIFEGLIEWVEFTIRQIRYTANTLIIRFHPSESTMFDGSYSLEQVIRNRNPWLKECNNIIFIAADKSVDSYALAQEYIDIGLIYSGMLALELTYMGIPVISCSHGFYSGSGFCFEPESTEVYKNMLSRPETVFEGFKQDEKVMKSKLFEFAHWFFFKAAYEMPIIDPNGLYRINYEQLKEGELDPEQNQKLQKVFNKLLAKVDEGKNRPVKKQKILNI